MNKIITKDGIPTLQVNDPGDLKEYLLVDVRTSEEFTGELGHIKGSQLATLGPDLDAFLKNQDKSKTVLFICRSGARSGRATEQALNLGFKEVYNMEGGMMSWNEKKFPVER